MCIGMWMPSLFIFSLVGHFSACMHARIPQGRVGLSGGRQEGREGGREAGRRARMCICCFLVAFPPFSFFLFALLYVPHMHGSTACILGVGAGGCVTRRVGGGGRCSRWGVLRTLFFFFFFCGFPPALFYFPFFVAR